MLCICWARLGWATFGLGRAVLDGVFAGVDLSECVGVVPFVVPLIPPFPPFACESPNSSSVIWTPFRTPLSTGNGFVGVASPMLIAAFTASSSSSRSSIPSVLTLSAFAILMISFKGLEERSVLEGDLASFFGL